MKTKKNINWPNLNWFSSNFEQIMMWMSRLVGIYMIGFAIFNYNKTTSLNENGILATAIIKDCSQHIERQTKTHYVILDVEYDGHRAKLKPIPYSMNSCPEASTIEVLYSAEKLSKVILVDRPRMIPFIGLLVLGLFLFLISFIFAGAIF